MAEHETVADIARQFDLRAPEYDESAFHRELAVETIRFAGAHGARSVLDVATGTGLVLRAFAPDSVDRLVGIDVSNGMLEVARAHLPHAELLRADAMGPLPFADGAFDLITCVTALHLLPDPSDALREWRRLLARGGRVVVAVFRTGDLSDVPEVEEAAHSGEVRHPHGSHPLRHERTGTLEALSSIASDAGLRLVRHETWVRRDPLEVCLLAELVPAAGDEEPRSAGSHAPGA